MEKITWCYLRNLVVGSDKAIRLNKTIVTRLKKKRTIFRPELKLTGFDFVPREYFFW
jgi:hypothetical protein